MTGRGLAVQGGLAVLGLAIAYGTWQREPDRATGEVVVVDATKSELANVHYEDETETVDIRRGNEAGEAGVWLRVQDKVPVPSVPAKPPTPKPVTTDKERTAAAAAPTPPPSPTPAPAAPPSKPRPLRELRGDEPADKLLASFTPFRAPRGFGVLDAAKLKELGLDAPKKKLVVTARGETREFSIGQPAVGNGESYLRDVKDGRIYVMPRQILNDLQGAAHRLVDRRLHTFKIPEVNRVVVKAGSKNREFVIKNNQDATAYKLAPSATPDKPDEMARNWHDKVWRMFPLEVLGKGETPSAGEPKVAMRVEYYDGAKNVGWLEIAKLDVPPGPTPPANPHAPPGQNNGIETYARSEHTSGWVRLNNDPSVLAEAEKIAVGS